MMAAVAEVGPVAMAIDHRHRSFQVSIVHFFVEHLVFPLRLTMFCMY